MECHQFVLFRPDDEDGHIVRELGDRVECSFVRFLDAADVRVDTEPEVSVSEGGRKREAQNTDQMTWRA